MTEIDDLYRCRQSDIRSAGVFSNAKKLMPQESIIKQSTYINAEKTIVLQRFYERKSILLKHSLLLG